jgi:hypothetical protein
MTPSPRTRDVRISRAARAGGLACLLLLAACGNDPMRSFGLVRDPPDEFQVSSRAPLTVPPDFNLRPPQPGQPRPQEGPTRNQAAAVLAGRQGVVVGSAAPAGISNSPGEAALLAAAGPAAPANVRARIDDETTLIDQTSRGFTDRLLFWRTPEQPGIALDPAREQARLRENAALGRPQTAGDTPIIQRRQRGLFEGIF